MIPVQYIIPASGIAEALAAGCRWIQTDYHPDEAASWLHDCHAAGCYLVFQDDVEAVRDATADGVFLSAEAIRALSESRKKPSGIVLQSPRPVSTALHVARETLGEDSPQLTGVWTDNADDAITAAKAGADYVQLPAFQALQLAREIRTAGCNIPLVARFGEACTFCTTSPTDGQHPAFTPDFVLRLLDAGINGIACTSTALPPLSLPLLLHADE